MTVKSSGFKSDEYAFLHTGMAETERIELPRLFRLGRFQGGFRHQSICVSKMAEEAGLEPAQVLSRRVSNPLQYHYAIPPNWRGRRESNSR